MIEPIWSILFFNGVAFFSYSFSFFFTLSLWFVSSCLLSLACLFFSLHPDLENCGNAGISGLFFCLVYGWRRLVTKGVCG